MQGQRASDPGTVTAYKLQSSPGKNRTVRFMSWDLPDAVGGFPGSVPPLTVRRSSGKEEAKGSTTGRRSTAAFADPDYFTRPSIDIAQHDGLRSPLGTDPVPRSSKTLPGTTEADVLGYSSDTLTTTIYVPETNELPDWYVELTPEQMHLLHKVLRLLDARELSVLDRSELFELLKGVIDDVTQTQVNQAIDDLQEKSSQGQVDFDEFMYALAEVDKSVAEEGRQEDERKQETTDGKKRRGVRRYSLAQKVYYSAIALFSVFGAIQSPLELQRKHKTREDRGPHLLGHFLQSKTRKLGRSKRLLKTLMTQMLLDARGQFSPYIHPLPFVRIGKRRRTPPHQCPRKKLTYPDEEEEEDGEGSEGEQRPSVRKSIKIHQLSPVAMAAFRKMSLAAEDKKQEDRFAEEKEIFLDDDDIANVLQVYADNGSVVARLPDIHLIPGVRNTLARISIYDPLCSSQRKRRQTMKLLRKQLQRLEMEDPKVRLMRQRTDRIKFFMPSIRRFTVPIPRFSPTKCERLNVTPINIENMQKRINRKLEEYRYQLKMSHVRHAWKLLERLPLEQLPSGCRERFLQVYRAYEPLRVRDIYVISPYVPHITYLD